MRVLCFIALALLCPSTCSQASRGHGVRHATEADFLRLYSRLLHNYSRHVRPISNQSAAIDVSLDFSLLSISDVDDVKQQIAVMAMVKVQWIDKNLIWNPAEYGGINRMFLKQQYIWAPEVYVASGHSSATLFTLPTQHTVRSGGTVTFTSVGNVDSPCSLDLTVFPYDTQACKFGFGVLDSTIKEVNLTVGVEGVKKSKGFVENGEWEMYGTDSGIFFRGDGDDMYGTVHAILKIKRRSTYYIINIIVPAAAIAMLSLLTFAVPVESGERLAYALTILLSLSVYITYIGSIMPMSSVNMPIIFFFLLGLFMMSSMCVVMTVLVIAIRWSHVILVTDYQKTIVVFGVPFNIQRTSHKHDLMFRCCAWRLQGRKNGSKLPEGNRRRWPPDRQELWELENLDVFTLENQHEEDKEKSSFTLSFTQNKATRTRSSCNSLTGDKVCPQTNKQSENSSDKSDKPGYEQDADPDIMCVCNRLNLYSFTTLLLGFVLLFAFTFLQFHHQFLPE